MKETWTLVWRQVRDVPRRQTKIRTEGQRLFCLQNPNNTLGIKERTEQAVRWETPAWAGTSAWETWHQNTQASGVIMDTWQGTETKPKVNTVTNKQAKSTGVMGNAVQPKQRQTLREHNPRSPDWLRTETNTKVDVKKPTYLWSTSRRS